MATYSLRVVMEHLDSKELTHRFSSGPVGMSLYEHGCKVDLPGTGGKVQMSIQTHPTLAGPAFAETAVLKDGKLVYFASKDGDNVVRHDTPEELFEHIRRAIDHFGDR